MLAAFVLVFMHHSLAPEKYTANISKTYTKHDERMNGPCSRFFDSSIGLALWQCFYLAERKNERTSCQLFWESLSILSLLSDFLFLWYSVMSCICRKNQGEWGKRLPDVKLFFYLFNDKSKGSVPLSDADCVNSSMFFMYRPLSLFCCYFKIHFEEFQSLSRTISKEKPFDCFLDFSNSLETLRKDVSVGTALSLYQCFIFSASYKLFLEATLSVGVESFALNIAQCTN